MQVRDVYINAVSSFLPGEPVSNGEMETRLGRVNGHDSKSKNIVLKNNGIQSRYYALDKSGNTTYTNADMAERAIRGLFPSPESLNSIEVLACGTSSPDQMIPSHATMVHGKLKNIPMEVVSPSGVCCSGMHALKYAYFSVASGQARRAVCTGSERSSKGLSNHNYMGEMEHIATDFGKKSNGNGKYLPFEKEFLRWMLSDGAGAMLLEDLPSGNGPSLKIDWIELVSFANEMETCMYMGSEKMDTGELKGWMEYDQKSLINRSVLSLKQDTRQLGEHIVKLGIGALAETLRKKNILSSDIDYFLPHMSSYLFQPQIYEQLAEDNIPIPMEKWVVNLSQVGNVGSASIYLALEELFKTGTLEKNQKILLLVPESARFSYAFVLMTVR